MVIEIEEGDSDLLVMLKTTMLECPELRSLTFATKNGIMIRTTGTEKEGRLQTALLSLLSDKARAVAREFQFGDEVQFMTIRTTKAEYMIYIDKSFFLFGCLEPTFRNRGEPDVKLEEAKKAK